MTESEFQLECLALALQTPNVDDVLQMAADYYRFVTGDGIGGRVPARPLKLAPRVVADDDDD